MFCDRVREKLIEFEGMTDRNAKHMYIEKCQTAPGYNCTFYTVKVSPYYIRAFRYFNMVTIVSY